ncbi:MAG TPA: DNA polymerase Y family protein [Caulobacteraceae bacterium]|nr:DNA polymerase Y family protein [Caulobacteraceae bacterium]
MHLWLDRLSIDRVRRANPTLGSPLALTVRQSNALRIQALDRAAEAMGLVPGMTLASARAQVPELLAADADANADLATLKGVAEACRRYTPSLAVDAPDGIDLNVTGAAPLFGGEATLADDLVSRLAARGFSARYGIADTPGLAWALARHGQRPIAEPGERADILAPLPMAALRLEEETLAMLRGLGLRRVGQIAPALARPALARRLGEGVLQRLDEALGTRAAPLVLKLEISPYCTERRLAEPVGEEDQVLRLAAGLAADLCRRLEAERLGARLFVLELHRVDGAVRWLKVAASRPLRDPVRIAALFAERIGALNEGLEADFGFDLLRLWARRTQPAEALAQDLLQAEPSAAGFAALVDRLSARLGQGVVRRVSPAPETRTPELCVRAAPFDPCAPAAWTGEPPARDEGVPLRPLTLFAAPQPIEVTAVVPEGAPDRFKWRRLQRLVVAAEGPERLEPEWGRATELARTRDYYRLEDETGRRYWVFREGRYDRPGEAPRWFIHGLFA